MFWNPIDFGNLAYAVIFVVAFSALWFASYVLDLIVADVKRRIRRYLRRKGH